MNTQTQTKTQAQAQAQAVSAAVNVGALFASKNGSVKCPFVGLVGDSLLCVLDTLPEGQQWKLFTQPTEEGGLTVVANVSSTVVGERAPWNDNVPVCTLERTRNERTPYRGELSPEAREALGLGNVTVLATWRTAASGLVYLTLFYVTEGEGGESSYGFVSRSTAEVPF
jgi:hypothetical protein